MEREKINKVLELDRLQEKVNNLNAVLDYHSPSLITITNNTGISKTFDIIMIGRLKDFVDELQNYIDKSFEEL